MCEASASEYMLLISIDSFSISFFASSRIIMGFFTDLLDTVAAENCFCSSLSFRVGENYGDGDLLLLSGGFTSTTVKTGDVFSSSSVLVFSSSLIGLSFFFKRLRILLRICC